MLVSILIPTYNRPQYLPLAIESVLKKGSCNWHEIIVINDGGIIPEIKYDGVKLITKKNGGVSSAVNLGIKEAKGELITVLHDDDILLESIDKRVNEFLNYPALEVLYTSAMDIDENGKEIKKYTMKPLRPAALWKGDEGIYMPTMMWRKSIHDRIGYFSEDLISNEDYEFKLKCAMECVMKGIDVVTIGYRRHPGNKSTINRDKMGMYDKILRNRLKERYKNLWSYGVNEVI